MADNTLQAFQLGASLFDRAQTQARMMEQFKQQTAQSLLQQQGLAMQNQIRDIQLADAIKNQKQLLDDTKNMDANVKAVDEFYADPTKPFPTFLPVSAPQNKAVLNQYRQQLDDFSERSKLMKGLAASRSALAGQLTAANDYAKQNNDYQALWDNNNGLDQYGNPDPEKIKIINSSYGPKMEQARRAEEIIKSVGQDVATELMKLPKEQRYLPESIKLAQEAVEAKKSSVPTAVIKNTEYIIKAKVAAAEAAGAPLSESKIRKLRDELSQAGGKLKPLDAPISKKINNDFAVVEAVDSVLDNISDFEKENKVDFTSYLGIIPTTVDGIKSRIAKESDPKKLEALGFLSNFYGLLNEVGTTTSGLTVTQQEGKRIEGEIGSRLDKNSLVKLRAFRNRKEEGLRGVIQRNMDRDLPSFAEEWVQTPFGTSSTSLYKFPTRAGQQQQSAPAAPTAVAAPSLPTGFSPSQTNQISVPSGWGMK